MSGKLLEEFPPVTTQQWEEIIQKDLKGADYAKKLIWQTDEGIAVKPYYRREDVKAEIRAPRHTNAWRVREQIDGTSPKEAHEQAVQALAAGVEEIEFVVGPKADIKALVSGLSCPVHFRAGKNAGAIFEAILAAGVDFEGSLDYDPVSDGGDLNKAAELAKRCLSALPRFRPFAVQARRFYENGGTITQEVGFGVATGIEYLAALTERGLTADQAASTLAFSFSAGTSFFFGIAKLRAARALWAQAVEAFHPAKPESEKAKIHVETAGWHLTVYDPYVNILRGTTEAMSAAIGGCESITVIPFDAVYRKPDEQSTRLARNTQLILKKEAWLDRVIDPAGGSYYVEVLSDSVARESWKLVQQVSGNLGAIPGMIEKSRAAKFAAVTSRRRTILGTNQYPDLNERMLGEIKLAPEERITPRAAEPFEKIRLRTEKSGKRPKFLLLEMGDLKMRKARAGFVTNFFGCAGFEIETVYAKDMTEAAAAIDDRRAAAVVLCSSDEEYSSLAAPLIGALRNQINNVPVIVAGYPKDAVAALTSAGVADFVHVRSNAAEVLTAWQERLGVKD